MKEEIIMEVTAAVMYIIGIGMYPIAMINEDWRMASGALFFMCLALPFLVGAIKLRLKRLNEKISEKGKQ